MRKAVAAVILGLAFASSAEANYFKNGNDIYAGCWEPNSHDGSYTLSYIVGVSDMDDLIQLLEVTVPEYKKVCASSSVTAGQLRDVVCKFMKDHPERRDDPAALLVRVAMLDAWPCH